MGMKGNKEALSLVMTNSDFKIAKQTIRFIMFNLIDIDKTFHCDFFTINNTYQHG